MKNQVWAIVAAAVVAPGGPRVGLGAELMQESRRPLDVGEQESDGAGWKILAYAA